MKFVIDMNLSPSGSRRCARAGTKRSTGTTLKAEALKIAMAAVKEDGVEPRTKGGPTFRRYAEPFFVWETCPMCVDWPAKRGASPATT